MKVLVNIPGKWKPGGVLSHYEGIRLYLSKHTYYFYPNGNYKIKLVNIFIFPFEWIRFILTLVLYKPNVVVLNPSLYPGVFLRDSIYLKTSILLGTKCLVFFHGWYDFYKNKITSRRFHDFYGKADSIIVLSSDSKKCIQDWGFINNIYLTTTKVDDHLLTGFDISNRKAAINNILFLARIEKYKGVYIAIETFRILKKRFPNLKLSIVGTGSELESVIKMIDQFKLSDIYVKGFLYGKALAQEYIDADIYLFPSFNEGLPATILEAMAFGLPIISSNVGGHRDFFNASMGKIVRSFNPSDYAAAIEDYIQDNLLLKKTNMFNHAFATKRFLASNVAADFERVISEI